MKDRIKDYFAFNKKEQRGLIILLGLMLSSVALNIFMPYFIPEEEFDIKPFEQEVIDFLASVKKQDSVRQAYAQHNSAFVKEIEQKVLAAFKSSPFYFDPNELSEERWVNMGMPSFIIRNILKYRGKGGTFRNKEGFRKIYGMNDDIFNILENYIHIKETEKSWTEKKPEKKSWYNDSDSANESERYESEVVQVDLNSADSTALLALHGIGPSYSSRIVRYRDLLGGFIRAEQLLEVRGMDSLRLAGFRKQLHISRGNLKKIDLNKSTFKEMLRHPYFEYYLVKAIFSFKDEIESFDSVGQLRTLPVMYDELYEKIAPYLMVELME